MTSLLAHWFKSHNTQADTDRLMNAVDNLESEYAILTLRFLKEDNKVIFKNRMLKCNLWLKKLANQYGKFLWEEIVN